MLYIFDPDENLIALLHPDFKRSTGPAPTSRAFLSAEYPAEFDREPTEGCPYWDDVHHEVLNGDNTFTFTVPAGQTDAAHVSTGNLVAFKDLDAAWQFFEIKKLEDSHGDNLTRTAYCEHILYELLDDIVTDKRPSTSAIAAMASMLEGTRWQVGIVDDLGTSSTTAYYVSALEAVQAVATAWKGELQWRCVVTGGVITRYVDLLAMRGTDTGKQFAYSKDILSVKRTEHITTLYTAMYGRGKGVETESGDGYGRRLTIADADWSVANGDPTDKPLGQEWVGDPAALARWGRPGSRHRFGIYTNEEQEDPEALLQETWDNLQANSTPVVTYEMDVITLEEVSGYEHEAVRLGDLVRAIDREFNPPLVESARVIELERDLLNPEATKVVLGNFAPTIVDAVINTQRDMSTLKNQTYNTAWLDGRISILQNEIDNTAAYVFQSATDGILIMDAPTFTGATKAMKLGGGIFALANSKSGGTWNWRTFGDGGGFTGDEINAGLVKSQYVQVGAGTEFEAGYDPSAKSATFTSVPTDGKYKQDDLLIPAVGFSSGGVSFYAGEVYRALTDGNGTSFIATHWSSATLLSAWKKTGTTLIDGGQLAADTVTANALLGNTAMVNFLNALNITAKYISASGIQAGTITLTDALKIMSANGNLTINENNLIFTHSNGTQTILSAAGLQLLINGVSQPYISTVKNGIIDENTDVDNWYGSDGDGHTVATYRLNLTDSRWIGKADKVSITVFPAVQLRFYDSGAYRDDGIKEYACKVQEIQDRGNDGIRVIIESWESHPTYSGSTGYSYKYRLPFSYLLILNG